MLMLRGHAVVSALGGFLEFLGLRSCISHDGKQSIGFKDVCFEADTCSESQTF